MGQTVLKLIISGFLDPHTTSRISLRETWCYTQRECPAFQDCVARIPCSVSPCREAPLHPVGMQRWIRRGSSPQRTYTPCCFIGHAHKCGRERYRKRSLGIQTAHPAPFMYSSVTFSPFWIHLPCSLAIFFNCCLPYTYYTSPLKKRLSLWCHWKIILVFFQVLNWSGIKV